MNGASDLSLLSVFLMATRLEPLGSFKSTTACLIAVTKASMMFFVNDAMFDPPKENGT